MNSRIEEAVARHKKGYNCSQAVLCTYCDLFDMDEKTAFRVAEGFGGGMGGMHGTCGAVTGMFMTLGLLNSDGNIEEPGKTKKQTYAIIRHKAEAFQEKNSSMICADLLGVSGKPKLRSCDGCIEDSARIIEEYINTNGE